MDQTKVLLIDGDETSRNFLAQMLLKQNYLVYHAGDGQEGIHAASLNPPDLIIFDTNLKDLTTLELVEKLKQNPHTSQTPYIVLSSHSDPEEMQACLQAGCSEYYVKSGMVMMTMVEALPRLFLNNPRNQRRKEGLLFVFLSAKGGTGTSSLCANIAMNIAQHIPPSTVAVVDMVLPMGSLAQIVGADEDGMNLIKMSEQPFQTITSEYFQQNLVTPPHWLFHLLPGSPDPEKANHLAVDHIPGLFDTMRKAYDFIMVDLGRAMSKISLPIIQAANLVVLVLGTDLSTVALTKKAWKYLHSQGITEDRLFPILNRAVGLEGLTKSEAEKILGFEIKLTVPYMTGNFALANNQHMPINLKLPHDTVSMVLKQAALDMSTQAIKIHER